MTSVRADLLSRGATGESEVKHLQDQIIAIAVTVQIALVAVTGDVRITPTRLFCQEADAVGEHAVGYSRVACFESTRENPFVGCKVAWLGPGDVLRIGGYVNGQKPMLFARVVVQSSIRDDPGRTDDKLFRFPESPERCWVPCCIKYVKLLSWSQKGAALSAYGEGGTPGRRRARFRHRNRQGRLPAAIGNTCQVQF